MKQSVIGAGIFGASRQTNPRRASVAKTVKWESRLLSNTEILNAYRGKATSIPKLLLLQSMKESPFFPAFEIADTLTASIRNTSKSLSLLVK
jgi:hypothetical protein